MISLSVHILDIPALKYTGGVVMQAGCVCDWLIIQGKGQILGHPMLLLSEAYAMPTIIIHGISSVCYYYYQRYIIQSICPVCYYYPRHMPVVLLLSKAYAQCVIRECYYYPRHMPSVLLLSKAYAQCVITTQGICPVCYYYPRHMPSALFMYFQIVRENREQLYWFGPEVEVPLILCYVLIVVFGLFANGLICYTGRVPFLNPINVLGRENKQELTLKLFQILAGV